MTYRQGKIWTSELDLVLMTPTLFTQIDQFNVSMDIKGSDHAPITISLEMKDIRPYTNSELLERAQCLGVTKYEQENIVTPKSINYHQVHTATFANTLLEINPPVVTHEGLDNITETIKEAESLIMYTAKKCKKAQKHQPIRDNVKYWERVLLSKDSKAIWQAVDWKGKYNVQEPDHSPTDKAFKEHFESLLNNSRQPDIQDMVEMTQDSPYIPILDDAFDEKELDDVVKNLKPNKGYIGIAPGLIKCLPVKWLIFILGVFNLLFQYCSYPMHWTISKLITIFKSGESRSCGNYRGISIPNTLAKLYDMLLFGRLSKWCAFDKCQAGGQAGRGCIEQIMTLRLAIDHAAESKSKLYVLFIDFSKAYDRVERRKMIDILKGMGCGRAMLISIILLYKCTQFILKSAIIIANQGVRQGASTSIILFVLYIDRMVRLVKSVTENDGFLGKLHTLVLMDDTVILSCSREVCKQKMAKVLEFCDEFGMRINVKKTSFFVINGGALDKEPMMFKDVKIPYKSSYCYLGSFFTDDGKISTAIKMHIRSKTADINKFTIFCAVNTSIPFYIKKQIFDSCLLSSLLYGCETWNTNNLREVEHVYIRMIRILLGVRKSTPIANCLIELGQKNLTTIVNEKRKSFLMKKFKNVDPDEPFHAMMEICRSHNNRSYKMITKLMNNTTVAGPSPRDICLNKGDTHTKFVLYRSIMNESLSMHPVYSKPCCVPDYQRVVFTRFRLTSHNLISEKGRWSRTPPNLRVCPCDGTSIQDEHHAILLCNKTTDLRRRYRDSLSLNPETSIKDLMLHENITSMCEFIYLCMKEF